MGGRTKIWFLLVLAMLALVACGEDTETVRVTDRYTLDMLGKGVSLTEEVCDSARVGQLLYVGDSSSIYYCTGKAWKKINGKDGKDGRDGKDGEDGTDGKRGNYGTSGTDCFVDEFADGLVLGCGATKAIVHYDFEIPDTCSIKLVADSSYVLTCGEESATLIQGSQGGQGATCVQTDMGDGRVKLACGSDSVITYKAQCGETPFDPDGSLFCYGDTLVGRCNTHIFDIEKLFCYNDSLIPLCGGKSYDLKRQFCDERDGWVYGYTVIGEMTWMSQNLDFKVPDSFCDSVHKDGDLHCGIKGRFYPWNVAMAKEWSECGQGHSCSVTYPHQGVCPDGWHLPTIQEWSDLRDVMGTYDFVYWDESVVLHNRSDSLEVLTNEYGFSAIPTGVVDVAWTGDSFQRKTEYTIWDDGFDAWSSTEADKDKAELCFFYTINEGIYKKTVRLDLPYLKESTRTVRCVKD